METAHFEVDLKKPICGFDAFGYNMYSNFRI